MTASHKLNTDFLKHLGLSSRMIALTSLCKDNTFIVLLPVLAATLTKNVASHSIRELAPLLSQWGP
jgi:hypothetical protein